MLGAGTKLGLYDIVAALGAVGMGEVHNEHADRWQQVSQLYHDGLAKDPNERTTIAWSRKPRGVDGAAGWSSCRRLLRCQPIPEAHAGAPHAFHATNAGLQL